MYTTQARESNKAGMVSFQISSPVFTELRQDHMWGGQSGMRYQSLSKLEMQLGAICSLALNDSVRVNATLEANVLSRRASSKANWRMGGLF